VPLLFGRKVEPKHWACTSLLAENCWLWLNYSKGLLSAFSAFAEAYVLPWSSNTSVVSDTPSYTTLLIEHKTAGKKHNTRTMCSFYHTHSKLLYESSNELHCGQ